MGHGKSTREIKTVAKRGIYLLKEIYLAETCVMSVGWRMRQVVKV